MTARGLVLALAITGCAAEVAAPPDGGATITESVVADAAPTCGDVPSAGTCTSATTLARCVDGAVLEETCASACVELGGEAVCAAPDVCAGVGPLGRCDGDVLWRCDGAPIAVDCGATGKVCGYRDDAQGYRCVAASTLGPLRLSGTVRWEDRPLSPGHLGDPVARPARGVMVAVVDHATNQLISTVSTADDGSYVAHYHAPASGQVRVAAYSRSRSPARPARVRDDSGYLHAVGSAAVAAGSAAPLDVLVTAASSAGGAWNALDNAVLAMDWLRARGVATIAPVYIYWQATSDTGSYYQRASNTLRLDGDDGYDDVVMLHEMGHYVQDEYSRSDSPGGAHDGSPADPRLAWGEGGATWFALALRDVPYYIDHSAGGGWYVELEHRVHKASATGALSQNVSEWMVAELLWDLSDGGGEDPIIGSAGAVWTVLAGYLISPQRVDRGRGGTDLVEMLDGWFVHWGHATCNAMRTLVQKYQFPYDLGGPAACP